MANFEQKKPRKEAIKTDVLVVGAGLTGLLCSFFLKKAQIAHLIVDSGQESSTSFVSAGLASAYPREHLTRMAHAYGRDVAKDFANFQLGGWKALQTLCGEMGISCDPQRAIRIAVAEHELKELEAANRLQSEIGENQDLLRSQAEFADLGLQHSMVKAVQINGANAALLDAQLFYDKLKNQASAASRPGVLLQSKATQIEETPGSVIVHLEGGSRIQTQMLVLATHLGIRELRPEFKEIAIPIVEQWELLQFNQTAIPANISSYLFTAHYGYYWGAVDLKNRQLRLGGARFMRHHAGIGAELAEAAKDIKKHLIDYAKSLWNFPVAEACVGPSRVGLDCQPCDELPVIGPLPGSGRLLTCFGYNGNSYPLAMAGAKALTDIIVSGHANDLPRFLGLERFRGLKP